MPVRTDNRRRQSKRSKVLLRRDLHIERLVGTGNENNPLNDWLISFTRQNRPLKGTRNLGGLSLTFVEANDLNVAIGRKYKDYGLNRNRSDHILSDIARNLSQFIQDQKVGGHAKSMWHDAEFDTKNRLETLGSASCPSLCLVFGSKALYAEHEMIMDYLQNEEKLNMTASQKEFKPHITIVRAPAYLLRQVKIPQHPHFIHLESPVAVPILYSSK